MRVLADQIDRVLQIQKNYNNYSLEERKTAPEFIERGQLVEESIVNFYNNFLNKYNEQFIYKGLWNVAGSNGKFKYFSKVPWTRIYVPDFSESATKGFYITNLFSFDGSCMYLSLNQASFESMNFIKLEPEVIMERVNWAREISKTYLDTSNLEEEINLSVNKGDKAYQYQKTNIYSKKLKINEIPDDEDIEKSLLNFIQSLEAIYSNLSRGKVFSNHFEISEELINENYELAYVSNSNSGQGLLKYEERNAVDKHGMLKAKEYFKSLGWDVKDVSKVYGGGRDLDCKKDGIEKVVEVKSTTTQNPSSVYLTKNEVCKSREDPAKSVLLIVSGIEWVDRTNLKLEGGDVKEIYPWRIDDEKLHAEKYKYTI